MKTPVMKKYQSYLSGGISTLAALTMLLGVVTPAIGTPHGNSGNPLIAPPQSSFRGKNYSEWSAGFFQYANSMQLSHHPFNDSPGTDCSTGQTGNVWFIDGTMGTPFPPEGRNCTIPPDTALFLAIKASWTDNESCDPSTNYSTIKKTELTTEQLRNQAQANLLGNYGYREVIIDDVRINGLPAACSLSNITTCESPYLVQTPVFNFTIPATDNIEADNGNFACYNDPNKDGSPYLVTGAVGDGFYMMIKPLNKGNHTIRFGPIGADGLPTRLYNITVKERKYFNHDGDGKSE
jgi:hypothetical protein